MKSFADDRACLDYLWRERFAPDGSHTHCPKCDRERKFHRVADRPCYDCDTCGHHIHPTAGTIFHKSATSLHLWFYAMYIIASTRCGVSAKQLERELGVTYKTAWRMFNLIRNQVMADDDHGPLSGSVEAGSSPCSRTACDSVSVKWLQGYLNEYTWRYNRRDNGRAMFLDLIQAAASKTT
jgi:transposase